MARPPDRTAVFVIRAWLEGEEDAKPKLRARMTFRLDIAERGEPAMTSAASEREIVRAVRSWLRDFVAGR